MATHTNTVAINVTAAIDFRNMMYEHITINTNGKASRTGHRRNNIHGIITQNPDPKFDTTGRNIAVNLLHGILLVKTWGAIQAGYYAVISSEMAGRIMSLHYNDLRLVDTFVLGTFLDSATENDSIVRLLAQPTFYAKQ